MPTSNIMFKTEIKEHVLKSFGDRDIDILDVGAGVGQYSKLLREFYPKMDTIEIFEPYIERYKLKELYRNVFIGDILDFEFDFYNLIIMGDVLEHLEYKDGYNLIEKIYDKCDEMIICVPYNLPAGEYAGNIHETHLQPDLNKDNMLIRYPMLKEVFTQVGDKVHNCGVYMKGL
jgi:SAM-dependent methyltransferase